jgi:hypothetical protein
MVKHADRWPPAYFRAINQLADVIATFPPEKVPPFQLLKGGSNGRPASIPHLPPNCVHSVRSLQAGSPRVGA